MNNLDDCFRTTDTWITVAEAIQRFSRLLVGVTQTETVSIKDSLDRILATQLAANHSIPPYNNSAVDGYAVYFDDLDKNTETRLPVTGRIAAGHPLNRPAKRHEALHIFTGAPLPKGLKDEGPDTIFMLEDVEVDGKVIIVPPGIKRYANFRNAGDCLLYTSPSPRDS